MSPTPLIPALTPAEALLTGSNQNKTGFTSRSNADSIQLRSYVKDKYILVVILFIRNEIQNIAANFIYLASSRFDRTDGSLQMDYSATENHRNIIPYR
jgi:hypothetical protein